MRETNEEREQFGSRLRKEREARSLSLAEIARVTKIPERSLEHLEAGSFDKLPGDVFVRGFLKSYCRAVGIDVDLTLRRYGELAQRSEKPKRDVEASRDAPVVIESSAPERDGTRSPTQETSVLSKAISDAGRSTKRVSLTLAVIILVIVATLTLSLLLRRPSHVGDGLSWRDAAPRVADRVRPSS